MFYEQWTKDGETPMPVHTSCLGDLFEHPHLFVYYYFDANIKAQPELAPPNSSYSSDTSRATEEEVTAHIKLLRAAGFVFSHEMVEKGFLHTTLKPVRAHRFFIRVDDMTPVMRRFALNGIRWIAENHGCRIAFGELCKTIDLKDPLEVFNAFLVASLADERLGAHNVGLSLGYYRPITKAEYKHWTTEHERVSMNGRLSVAIVRDHGLREPHEDFTYLQKPGGYDIYRKRLKAAQDWAKGDGKVDGVSILAEVMGLAALRAPQAVAV